MNRFHRAYILGGILLSVLTAKAQTTRTERELKADQYYYQGVLAEKQGDKRSALDLYEHAYRLDRQNAAVALALSALYKEGGQQVKADSLMAQSYALDNSDMSVMIAYVDGLFRQNKTDKAIDILEQWLKKSPNDDTIAKILAYTYFHSGKVDKAVVLYARLRDENKSLPNEYAKYSLRIASMYDDTEKHERAMEELNHLMSVFPEQPTVALHCISYLQSKGYYAESYKILQQLEQQGGVSNLELYPLYLRYYESVADTAGQKRILTDMIDEERISGETKMNNWLSFIQTKESSTDTIPQEYNPIFDKILLKHPDDTNIRLIYARILEAQKNRTKSIELLESLSKTMPEDAEVWTLLLFQLMVEERYKEVIALAPKAVQYHPTEWRIVYFASISYYQQEQKAQSAIKYLKNELRRLDTLSIADFGRSKLWAQLGDLYDAQSDKKQAMEAYDKAISYDADNAEVLNNYAYLLALEGKDLEQAERMALRGLKNDKNNENLLDTYAWILYLKKQYSLAELYMRKAIEQVGEDINATYYDHYGFIQLAQGKPDEARKLWLQALEYYRQDLKTESSAREKKKAKEQIRLLEEELKKLSK